MPEFTHLHLHTAYSLLDGAIRLPDLFPRVLGQGMKTVAVTDHGNMFGAIDFYKQAKEAGVKPIFGCETYVSSTERKDRSNRRNFHLVLLAKNNEGYRNLAFLNSMGFLEGFYYHPRIDKGLLREHARGLVGLSACLGGELAQALMKQGEEKATEVALEYASIFEPGQFFLEVQPNGLEEQEQVNQSWRRIAKKTGIPLVATNDCHYVNRTDARAHEILMCIQQGKTVHDERKLHHKVDAYYIKSPEEMNAYFNDMPEAMENAARLGAECKVELELGKLQLPKYRVPGAAPEDDAARDEYLCKIAREGLERRLLEARARGRTLEVDQYRERLERELGVICKMGFAGYFLIVWDFINYAKENGIPVGPGRGSGAGSLVAYAMRITDLDPLPYKLLFERFLNPERVSMPDFDVDFCMNRRDDVIKYVTAKYGEHNVGQIATMHQMKARLVIRDVARALGFEYGVADKIAKLVPEPVQGKSPPLPEAIKVEPRLGELYDSDPKCKELLDVAMKLENLNRHAGMHAAGVVIAERPLWEYVPCFRGQNDELVTQFAMKEVELAGLVKFDFLGLKTLTVIDTAVRLIRAGEQPDFELGAVTFEDPEVYKMISAGETTGVFQMESSGFRELLKKLKPDCFEDIVAAGALYRPGPLEGGMVDDFIKRKHGQTRVEYPHPLLEPILRDTYGVVVYQEQVMQTASALAGYTLGQADLLRRAMGKKNKEAMAKEKARFLAGAESKGVDIKIADYVFDLVEKFSSYGFNRSHSAAYAVVTFQTAYLKRYFPVEFMAALLTCDKDKTENIVKFIAEARAMGIEVLRPDVDESDTDFSVVRRAAAAGEAEPAPQPGAGGRGEASRKVIRFGLGAVKGIGEGAVEAILEARRQGGPFQSLYDFCDRIDHKRVNRRVLEALVKSGAFDGLAERAGASRARLATALERAVERAQAAQRDRESGQTSLFGAFEPPAQKAAGPAQPDYPAAEDWTPKQQLAFERESLGFYITGHPLDRYADDLRRYATATTAELGERGGRSRVAVGGIVANFRERPLKSGTGRIAFFDLEDPYGQVEVLCFSKAYEQFGEVLKGDEPILVSGVVQMEGQDEETLVPKLRLEEAVPLGKLRTDKTTRMHLHLQADGLTRTRLEELRGLLAAAPGSANVYLHLVIPKRSETVLALGSGYQVKPTDDLLLAVERLFGGRVAQLR
jgi:DNA polymerase-3 subunit alpha